MHKSPSTVLFIAFLIVCIAFKTDTNPLAGKWEYSSTSKGQPFTLLATFRTNGTFDGFINKKAFVSGTYRLAHDTVYISDPSCDAKYEGTYKIEFFGKNDSLIFHAIEDTCVGRRTSTDGKLFRNVTNKPE